MLVSECPIRYILLFRPTYLHYCFICAILRVHGAGTTREYHQCCCQRGESTLPEAEMESYGKPEEVRQLPKGRMEHVKNGGVTVDRMIFEPGWRW